MSKIIYKYRMNKLFWFIMLAWPAATGWLKVPFFYALLPAYILTFIAVIIELKEWDFDNALKSVGGLVCMYVLWSIIYGACSGIDVGVPGNVMRVDY